MKMRKDILNVAVIISGIDEEYQSTILKGVQKCAEELNINISHFIAFGGILHNQKHDIGEFNIYNLVNYERFDGVILITNVISSPEITEQIVQKVKKAGIPAVSIDNDLDKSMYHIGIDNKKAMKEIVKHIIEVHNVKTVNYVSGPSDNPESILRFEAYREVLAEHDIPFEEKRVHHGFFRAVDGRNAVFEFINSELPFPEAIICANDAMAIAVITALTSLGKEVPEDVIVTGFDNVYNARNYYPEITSVQRPLFESGYKACQKIYNHIMGISQPRSEILETTPIYAQSCGCHSKMSDDIGGFKKENYYLMDMYNRHISLVNRMSCSLAESESIEENINNLKNFIMEIECEKFFLCMCENWTGKKAERNNTSYVSTSNMFRADNYLINGYTEFVDVPLVYCDNNFGFLEGFETSLMLPDLYADTSKSKIYYFVPVHFRERALGYCVICNSKFPLESPLFHTWIMNISNSLENIRKLMCLEDVLSEIDKLYVIDPLSFIYNRNGFNRNTDELFLECIREKRPAMIMFADMDKMKYINDTFGHKEGDCAIKSMADAISSACMHGEICARFGGDEFIIFAAGYNDEQAESLRNLINKNIDTYNEQSGKPYNIKASIGWHIDIPTKDTKLASMVTIADQKMYNVKKGKLKNGTPK